MNAPEIIAAYRHHIYYGGCRPEVIPGADEVEVTAEESFASDMRHTCMRLENVTRLIVKELRAFAVKVEACEDEDEFEAVRAGLDANEILSLYVNTDLLRDRLLDWKEGR